MCVVSSCRAGGVVSAIHVVERSPLPSVCVEADLRARDFQLQSQPGHPQRPGRRVAQPGSERVPTLGWVPAVRPGQATTARLHLSRGRTQPRGCHVGDVAALSSSSDANADAWGLLQQVLRHDVQTWRRSTFQGYKLQKNIRCENSTHIIFFYWKGC